VTSAKSPTTPEPILGIALITNITTSDKIIQSTRCNM
jgi:hypothetical protein